jgi:hypothetical protein
MGTSFSIGLSPCSILKRKWHPRYGDSFPPLKAANPFREFVSVQFTHHQCKGA